MQNDMCKNGLNTKRMVSVALDIPEENVEALFGYISSTLAELTDNQLDFIKTHLDKYFEPEMTEFFMKILSELQLASQLGLLTGDVLQMVSCECEAKKSTGFFFICLIYFYISILIQSG